MITIVLIVLGLSLGSFVNALVWRLHEQAEPKSKKSKKNPKNGDSQTNQYSILTGRSMCPDCQRMLTAADLIPVVSWLALKGKCRYCRRPIAWQYPLVEISTAGLFVASYYFWPLNLTGTGLLQFVLWLGFLVGFMALAVYDLRWKILPNRIVFPLIFLAMAQVLIVASNYGGGWPVILHAIWGVLISAGPFFILFEISRGRWIGGGDVKLGIVLGLLVGGPARAVLMLFMASVLGTLAALPFILAHKMNRSSQIPFGPFLLLATIITYLFGSNIIAWYSRLIVG